MNSTIINGVSLNQDYTLHLTKSLFLYWSLFIMQSYHCHTHSHACVVYSFRALCIVVRNLSATKLVATKLVATILVSRQTCSHKTWQPKNLSATILVSHNTCQPQYNSRQLFILIVVILSATVQYSSATHIDCCHIVSHSTILVSYSYWLLSYCEPLSHLRLRGGDIRSQQRKKIIILIIFIIKTANEK